ncbi:MAG: hypothetical protein KJZ84_00150 [Bryobacteraceae bacterium]|nr:hypothetical protein [Bryobacteraceae bacterium]
MIVTRIEAGSFRCFVEPFGVSLKSDTINLLQAPNGSGKSTLVEALRMAFLISHKSAGEDVKACAPWGRALSPRVTVEYESGGTRRRAVKQWLLGASATLEEWRAGEWEKIAEGATADEMLRQAAGMPGGFDKGAKGKDEFWTSVLWSVQGGLQLKAVDDSVAATVRASLNQQMESGAADRILKSIDETAARYWTPTGKAAKRSPVAVAEARLHEVRKRSGEARHRLRELETLRGDLIDMENERERFSQRLPALEEQLEAASEAQKQRVLLEATRDKELAAFQLLRHQAAGMQEDLRRWREAVQRVREFETKAAELEAGTPPVSGDPDAALAASQTKLKAAHAYLGARKDRDERRSQLDRCEQVAGEIRETAAALDALSAPSAADWPPLEKLHAGILAARERLESALVHLEVQAGRQLELNVITGEPSGMRTLASGETLRVSGSPAVEISAAGIGLWRASGPPASAADLRSALERLQEQWTLLTSGFGTHSYAELAERRAPAAELEKALQERRTLLGALLNGGTIESLRRIVLERDSACAAHEASYPEWTSAPPQPEQIEREVQAMHALRDARALREQARGQAAQIDAWTSARQSLETLARNYDDAALRLRGIELQIQSFEEQLRQFPADLDAQAATLAGELETAKRRLAQSRENSQLIRGRIEQLAATAPYQSLAEADEEGEEILRELAALSLAADAALLLRNTVAECRAALLDDVAGTVARDAGAILNEIAGAPLGELRLSTKLTPDALVPASWNEAVDLNQLSGGENEQVHFATRLALADRLSAQEPQLVVFDDVLMATDPERLARILALLEERRGRLQVLILTCHPERFAGLSEVHRAPLTRASL